MLVAGLGVHLSKGFWATKGGYEYNLVLLAGAVALAFTGPGRYSADAVLGIALPDWAGVAGAIATVIGVAAASRRPANRAGPKHGQRPEGLSPLPRTPG